MRRLLGTAVLALFTIFAMTDKASAADLENTLYMQLEDGRVVIEMRPDIAPKHVARIKELVRQKFYDGLTFHRVIDGFMAQTGDPDGNGTGGSGQNIPAEFTKFERFYRGTVGMARAQNPNSADSQFFIMYAPSEWLDGKYTIWGEVIDGMEYVDAIKKGDDSQNGLVQDPDKIITLRVAADVQ
ncbi:MAG: peptidylprolyl isomerase [Rhodospirillales bacterium]|nr:peptidylprolyl isomerase [Rhodospirillales bacterium]